MIRRNFPTSAINTRNLIPTSSSDVHHCSPTPSLADLLQSCIDLRSLPDTRRLHCFLLKTQLPETFFHNRLMEAYAKCNSLRDAENVFDVMPTRNVFTWNTMMVAYAKLGFVGKAVGLFEAMPERDQCSWNSMVSGFTQDGWFGEAIRFFVRMRRDGFVVGTHALSSALCACAGLVELKLGRQIHGLVVKSPVVSDVYMGSALVDMYSKCGRATDARDVFDLMPSRNVVTWNSMISCYEQNGHATVALDLFVDMMDCNLAFDEVTLASVVSACAALSAFRQGREIHAVVVKSVRWRDDLILSNALVDMYAKCGRMNEARRLFDGMRVRNVISETSIVGGYARSANVEDARQMFARMTERNVVAWNALIAGYTQNGQNEEALKLFRRLKRESSLWPTHYTFGNVLSACGNLTDLHLGRQTHGHILKHGFRFEAGPDSDIFVGNSLVDMYLKCGDVKDGSQVFEKMNERDRVSWNAMIVGAAQNGRGEEALAFFRRMLSAGETPDHVTMIGVLTGCSHAGLVDEGLQYLESMNKDYGLAPSRDHYTCMIDLLGRAGRLEEAGRLVNQMALEPDAVLWASLLGACRTHRNVEMGEWVAEKLLQLRPESSTAYVLLSNMYAERGQWKDVVRVRRLMKRRGVTKQPGCSWTEIEGKVVVFMVKDRTNPLKKEIYGALRSLRLQMKILSSEEDDAFS